MSSCRVGIVEVARIASCDFSEVVVKFSVVVLQHMAGKVCKDLQKG